MRPTVSIPAHTLLGNWISTGVSCTNGTPIEETRKFSVEITENKIVFTIQNGLKPIRQTFGPWLLQEDLLSLDSPAGLATVQISKPSLDELIADFEISGSNEKCPDSKAMRIRFQRSPNPPKKVKQK